MRDGGLAMLCEPHGPDHRERVRCGDYVISRVGADKLWIQSVSGEGMELSEAQFERLVGEAFARWF